MRPRLATRGSARAIAADVVARVLDDGAFTQPALSSALSSSGLDARDKSLVTELVYGTLRWTLSLEKSLLRASDKPNRGIDKRARPHLLVAAYQLQHLSERIPPHAAVSAAVDGVRHARPGLEGFANAILRRIGSAAFTQLDPNASIDLVAAAYGVPEFLARASVGTSTGADAVAAIAAINARPSTYAMGLSEMPDNAARHAFVPGAFVLEGGAVTDNYRFKQGGHVVMDPGSALCAFLVDASEGQRVLDLCAAPGTKTVLLARAVGASGRVVSVERDGRRRKKIDDNLVRTHLTERVEVIVADVGELSGTAPGDAVLLDAPCTGLGTTRRKPEIKLRRTEEDVETNHALQATLINAACDLVKPGGALVFSVCSPIEREGASHVDAVLARGFVLEDARATLPWLPADAVDARGCVRLRPHLHDTDAFFCARFRRSTS